MFLFQYGLIIYIITKKGETETKVSIPIWSDYLLVADLILKEVSLVSIPIWSDYLFSCMFEILFFIVVFLFQYGLIIYSEDLYKKTPIFSRFYSNMV